MKEFSDVNEILDFAIQNEQNAVDLYSRLAKNAKSPIARKTFEEYADEERGHKAKLEEVKSGKRMIHEKTQVQDLKIGDYLVAKKIDDESDYQSILIFAMHQEKAAFRLYTDLAERTDDEGIKSLFLSLAQEEAKHKLRFEVEYDDEILSEN